jgi:hypothetical protein
MTHAGHAWLTLVGGACLVVSSFAGCNSSSPRDINFGSEAGADFEVPPISQDSGAGTAGAAGAAGSTDVTGAAGGEAGAAGSTAGAGGSTTDAETDGVTDGGAG